MKKKMILVAAVFLLAALGAGAWFYGYSHRKNTDNIPSKELIAACASEKGDTFATEKLAGYGWSQLREAWGEPDGTLFGMWGEIWNVDENTQILVYFRTNTGSDQGIVEAVKLNVEYRKENP